MQLLALERPAFVKMHLLSASKALDNIANTSFREAKAIISNGTSGLSDDA